MKQTTVTEKRVSPRKTAAKAEVKPAAKPRSAVTARKTNPLAVAAGVVKKFHVFIEGARPVSGPRLAAHTNAALLFLGLAEAVPAKKKAVLALLGTRAVKYHRDIGNLEERADCLVLTAKGLNFFKGRVEKGQVDGDLTAAFLTAIQRGKANEAAQIKENHLTPVAMPLR